MQALWYHPLGKAVRAGAFLLAHTFIALLIIGLLSLVTKFIEYTGDHHLFGKIPLSYIIDAMDCGILLVFIVFGTIEAVQVFKGDENDEQHTR